MMNNSIKGAPFFTVFTPTYNRAHVLHRVYESLKKQTFCNFEWIIVDDGSTDSTKELVEEWILSGESKFTIRYFRQKNQHKKVAHNKAVSEAKGKLFVILDSDDYCVPEALEKFLYYWDGIGPERQACYAGVCVLSMYESGVVVGDRFPFDPFVDSTWSDITYKFRVKGEKWIAIRTDILKEYPFREDIPGLVPEATVWYVIGDMYKVRFVNEALRIYMQDVKGIIPRKNERSNPSENAIGMVYAKNLYLNRGLRYFFYSPIWFFLEAARLYRFWCHLSKEQKRLIDLWPHTTFGKLLVLMAIPIGKIMWMRDRWVVMKYKISEGES